MIISSVNYIAFNMDFYLHIAFGKGWLWLKNNNHKGTQYLS